ncbi:zinc-binding dehydrogenase [Candidatus Poribacteria bacterium]|nr:zinc-binding dehydrogenase [Candidatus Poribacteria bacterium]
MRSARIVEPMRIEIEDVDIPEVKTGQILIKNKYTGICGSDFPFFLNQRQMNYPLPPGDPGHECIGTVIQSRCSEYKEGDNVLALPLSARGFAEYFLSVPFVTVRLPDRELRKELVLAQTLGTVIHACRKIFLSTLRSPETETLDINIELWDMSGVKVGIVGQGSIGMLFTMMMKSMGADTVVGIDLMEYRLNIAKKIGASHTVNRAQLDFVKDVREISKGNMLDLVVEAVGSSKAVNDCISLTRRKGMVLVFGVPRENNYDLQFNEFFRKELNLVAAVGPHVPTDFPEAVKFVEHNIEDISQIISHVLPLENIQKAFEMAIQRSDNALKILLEF